MNIKQTLALLLLPVGLLVMPDTVSAQFECADCGWLPGAWCDYSPSGEYRGCTQCSYWACCITGYCNPEEEEVAVALTSDGSVISPFQPEAVLRTNLSGPPRARAVATNCYGAVLARYFDERTRQSLADKSRRITI